MTRGTCTSKSFAMTAALEYPDLGDKRGMRTGEMGLCVNDPA